MTIRECYELMGSDYEEVYERLESDAIIKRFVVKFLKEPSFSNLQEALRKQDGESAFRAAHSLKGICMNLGFQKLCEVSSALTEKLRGREIAGSDELYKEVEEEYIRVTGIINRMATEDESN